MFNINFLLLAFAVFYLLIGCSRENDESPVSGPSYCKDFNSDHLSKLKMTGTLRSSRYLRDLYLECDLNGRYRADAFIWAKKAAEIGDDKDKKIYVDFFGSSSESR